MARNLILPAESRLPDAILAYADREKVATADVKAIGGVSELKVSYYNPETKMYEDHDFKEFMEVTSLVGNLTQKDGRSFLHAHGNFGRHDMTVIGGHVVSAIVSPSLEVFLSATRNRARRHFDSSLGLNTIYDLK